VVSRGEDREASLLRCVQVEVQAANRGSHGDEDTVVFAVVAVAPGTGEQRDEGTALGGGWPHLSKDRIATSCPLPDSRACHRKQVT
jgi:hypothetical protein